METSPPNHLIKKEGKIYTMEDKIIVKISEAKSQKSLNEIYLDIYRSFINYEISSDDLSYYFGQLNSRYLKLKISPGTNDFFDATDDGLELDWFIRQPDEVDRVASLLKSIHNYAGKLAEEKGENVNEIKQK